jgi:PadR family transcriptional regulator, regulatory protein PadR
MTPVRELKKGSLGMLLLQLLRERPSDGYELSERLRARSDGILSFDEGAIYPLLHAYERRGLVLGYWETGDELLLAGEASAMPEGSQSTRKGPRRRYYRLTDRGIAALNTSVAEWHSFAEAIGRVLGGEDAVLDPGWSG